MNILRDALAAKKLGMARGTLWRLAKEDPDFPKPVKISPKITGWIEAEIDQYIAAKIAESRGKRAAA